MRCMQFLKSVVRALSWPVFMALLALLLLVPRPSGADTVKVNGMEFPLFYEVDEARLELRGAAVLRWARLVDLYAGAFYLPGKIDAKDWRKDVNKQLELCYFRSIPAKGFVEASQDHLQETLSAESLNSIQSRLDDLYRLFRDIGPGDRYTLTYTPDVGTVLSLNGEPLGSIPGADFAEAYFGIWLGENPLNNNFRDRVLGISAS